MNIIRPVTINDSVLAVSNITENDEAEWDDTKSDYAKNDRVMITSDTVHSIYIALQTPPAGQDPALEVDPRNPVYWARVSATNKWAMFSNQISDQSENAAKIEVELTAGALVNSMALFNIAGSSVDITVTDPTDGVVYDESISLVDDSGVNDWYAWYFEPISREATVAILDLPPYPSATIKIVINEAAGIAKCGLITMGALRELGVTTHGTSIGIQDYSRKEPDAFGNPIIIKRNFANTVDYAVSIETNYAGIIQRTLADFRTEPMAWIGSVNSPGTIVYGYYQDFNIVLSTPTRSDLSIEVQGLT